MVTEREERLGRILLEKDLLTAEELEKAIGEGKKTGLKLDKVLINLNLVKEKNIVATLKDYFKIEYIDLKRIKIDDKVLEILPERIVKKYSIIPVKEEKGKLTLSMTDPKDILAIDHVVLITGFEVIPTVSMESDILEKIEEYYGTKALEGIIVEDVDIKEVSAEE